jgi:hypothetical protein
MSTLSTLSTPSTPAVRGYGPRASVQRELPLILPPSKPLVHIRTAMDLLDRDEDAILNLIYDGAIAVAFDIAGKNSERREIRIHRKSLEAAKALACGSAPVRVSPLLSTIVAEILPPGDHFTATALKRRFTCNSGHVLNLIGQKLLLTLSDPKRGPLGSPLITRESASAFLHSRRIL